MKKIYKVRIEPNSLRNEVYPCVFTTHAGARPISVANQDGDVVLWLEVDTSLPMAAQSVLSVGTGYGRVPDGCRFVGTVQDGELVWHIYTLIP